MINSTVNYITNETANYKYKLIIKISTLINILKRIIIILLVR